MRDNKNRQRSGTNGGGSSFRHGGNRNSRGNSFSRAPREMHTVICSECKKECQVPFKPRGDKPVFCKECFEKHKPKRF